MKNENVLLGLMATVHGYAAYICGWRFYDNFVLLSCPIVAEQANNVSAALPIYMLNSLAFGALIYVATRPLMLLAEHVLDRVFCDRLNRIDR